MEKCKFIQVRDPEEGAEQFYQLLKEELENDRLQVLGLATGSTMIPVYKKLTESALDFSNVTTFNLDEYVGLTASSPNSYAYFMNDHLFSKKKFMDTNIPNGVAPDLDAECTRYERALQDAKLDIQLLGVGENGHIAFNEPGTPADSVTHIAALTDSTLGVNSQYFENDEKIPQTALTMGIASILSAKKLVLLAFGEKKRPALMKVLEGKIDKDWTITYLLEHDDVTIITDLDLK